MGSPRVDSSQSRVASTSGRSGAKIKLSSLREREGGRRRGEGRGGEGRGGEGKE